MARRATRRVIRRVPRCVSRRPGESSRRGGSRRGGSSGRLSAGGYTLIEVLVAVALLVVIATIVVPVWTRSRATERVDRADRELKALTDALDTFADEVGEWPASLAQLVTPIQAGDADVCGQAYNGGERASWAGPYLSRPVGASGVPVGVGTAAPELTRFDSGEIDYIGVAVDGVELGDVEALDRQVDGDGDPGSGTVRWTAAGGGQVTLTWMIPIPAC